MREGVRCMMGNGVVDQNSTEIIPKIYRRNTDDIPSLN